MSQNVLQTPIEYLKGVGPQRGALLRKELGIHKYEDLLNLFPNRYIDRTRYYKINELQNTPAEVQLIGKIINIKTIEPAKGKKRLVATFVDDTGQMELVWFQGQKWVKDNLQLNVPLVIFGKCASFGSVFNMAHPEMEPLSEHEKNLRTAMQPVYPSTETLSNRGISNRVISKLIQQLFLETEISFSETCLNCPSFFFQSFFNNSNSSISYGFNVFLSFPLILFIFTRAFTSLIPSVSDISV